MTRSFSLSVVWRKFACNTLAPLLILERTSCSVSSAFGACLLTIQTVRPLILGHNYFHLIVVLETVRTEVRSCAARPPHAIAPGAEHPAVTAANALRAALGTR
eukprot:728664-Pleurochrysis_carterae.AAC.1